MHVRTLDTHVDTHNICVCRHMHLYVLICAYMHTHRFVHVCLCMHVYKCAYFSVWCACACAHTGVPVSVCGVT